MSRPAKIVPPDTFRVLAWPVVEPVSIAEAKAQVGLSTEQTEWDTFLAGKIAAGRRQVETRIRATLIATQYRAKWLEPSSNQFYLPAPPLLVDETHELELTVDGQTVSAGELTIDTDSKPGFVELPSGVARGETVFTYWGGVATVPEVCPMLRAAILAFVNHHFLNRGILADGSANELPAGFDAMLAASSWSGRY